MAAYLRVSSRSQDLATQRHAVERGAANRGEPVTEWYTETRSAKSLKGRPVLAALRDAVRAGKIRVLYVYKLDRLGRSGIRDTLGLVDEFRQGGCRIVNLSDPFSLDAPGPFGELVLAMLAWFAEQERLIIGERIADARKRVESQGKTWGRPRRTDPEMLAKAKTMRENGKSIREISKALRVPRSTMADLLSEKPVQKPDPEPAQKQGSAVGLTPPDK